ncbi:unnamed protein product [Auanema sp. JU1783]|nr:unnamed protein product [Auanema sp. JU1783]
MATVPAKVEVKTEVADIGAIEEELIRIIQSTIDGVDMDHLTALTATYSPVDRQNAVNNLLSSKRVVIAQSPGGGLRLKINFNTQLSGASDEEQVIHSLIEDSKTKGIWIRELRDGSGLSQIQLRKVLKSLETKKLIKTVKAVGTTKKCYMLYSLEPDTSLTGGTFYSDHQLDSELIHTLVSVCTGYIQAKRKHAMEMHPDDLAMQKELSYIKTQEVSDFIIEKRLLNVAISLDDVNRILDVAILDGTIERRADGKVRASSKTIFSSAMVSVPCGICPVVDDCKPGHVIAPEKCGYMSDWLSGK